MNPRTLAAALPLAGLLALGIWLLARPAGESVVDPTIGSSQEADVAPSAGETTSRVGVGVSNGDAGAEASEDPQRVDPALAEPTGDADTRTEAESANLTGVRPAASIPDRAKIEPGRSRAFFGNVVSADGGDALAAAEVSITAWEGPRRPQRRRVVSNAAGEFDFGKLSARWVNVRVRHRDYLTLDLADLAVTGAPVELAVSPGGMIDGSVADKDGSALPYARIEIRDARGKAVRVTRSGENGEFQLSAVPPGRYEVAVLSKNTAASEEGGESEPANRDVLAKASVVVEVGEPVSVELSIRGK